MAKLPFPISFKRLYSPIVTPASLGAGRVKDEPERGSILRAADGVVVERRGWGAEEGQRQRLQWSGCPVRGQEKHYRCPPTASRAAISVRECTERRRRDGTLAGCRQGGQERAGRVGSVQCSSWTRMRMTTAAESECGDGNKARTRSWAGVARYDSGR
jgi:hypothetical protein